MKVCKSPNPNVCLAYPTPRWSRSSCVFLSMTPCDLALTPPTADRGSQLPAPSSLSSSLVFSERPPLGRSPPPFRAGLWNLSPAIQQCCHSAMLSAGQWRRNAVLSAALAVTALHMLMSASDYVAFSPLDTWLVSISLHPEFSLLIEAVSQFILRKQNPEEKHLY